MEIIRFVEKGELPLEEKRACELVLAKSLYEVLDGVLYHVAPDKTLRIVLADSQRRPLFDQVHAGTCGGYLRDAVG